MFSNTLSFLSSCNVSDQVSHPYKTTGKIIVLYIQTQSVKWVGTAVVWYVLGEMTPHWHCKDQVWWWWWWYNYRSGERRCEEQMIMVSVAITQAKQNALLQVYKCFIDRKKAFRSAPNTQLMSSFTNVHLKPYD
jgi:hypothetical protein